MRLMVSILTVSILSNWMVREVCAGIIFSENGGTLSQGTPVTIANTSFTYVRSGTNGSIFAENPGAFGSAAINLGGATTTSLNGIGWTSGIGDPSLSYFRFDVFSTNISGASSTLFFASGAGATFTGNTTFAGADLTFGFQINNGNLERRTGTGSGAWTAVPYSFSNSVGYTIQILGNRSGATQNYGLGSLANNSMDFFVNGVLVGDDWSFKDSSKAIDGFRIYQVNGGGRYQLDNIVIANDFTAVPEPSSFLLTAIATWLPFQLSRNRRRAKVTSC